MFINSKKADLKITTVKKKIFYGSGFEKLMKVMDPFIRKFKYIQTHKHTSNLYAISKKEEDGRLSPSHPP